MSTTSKTAAARRKHRAVAVLGLTWVALLFASCATPRTPPQRATSTFVSQTADTRMGRIVAAGNASHAGLSGFHLLNTGRQGFLARAALADLAERNLDMQYYIWEGDRSSKLLDAADRGVRIRLLLDDFYRGGSQDFSIAAADRHPNIEIRLFNPRGIRRGTVLRSLELVTRVAQMKHRMHNKLFVADNHMAIVGGRNIGDVYFGVSDHHNYRDLDVVTTGPVVSEISASFDTYWNSEWAVPVSELARRLPSVDESQAICRDLRAFAAAQPDFPYPLDTDPAILAGRLREISRDLVWGAADVVYDTPDKVRGDASENVGVALTEVLAETRDELVVVSPYLIPADKEMAGLAPLAERGAEIRILMNSLASNDVPVSQVVYARYRRRLLELGAELFELRAEAASRSLYTAQADPSAYLSLHAKAAIFDREVVCIGSYNIDRLGAYVITEIGLVIHSPELAQQLIDLLAVDLRPENAWQISLEQKEGARKPEIVWRGKKDGEEEIRATREPDVGCGRRTEAFFLSLVPIR
jgi:putative cardiolipin synthase